MDNAMNKFRSAVSHHSVLWGLVAATIAILVFYLGPSGRIYDIPLARESVAACTALALMAVTYGLPSIKPSMRGFELALETMVVPICFSIMAGAIVTASFFIAGDGLKPEWPARLVCILVYSLLIGLFEEGAFRGLILNGFARSMGSTTKGLLGACVISSLLFGLAHVIAPLLYSDGITVIQIVNAVLKTIQAAMPGFMLGASYLAMRNLWSVAIVHGLNDLFIIIPTLIFNSGTGLSGNYTSDSIYYTIAYLISMAIYIPGVISAVRVIKRIPTGNVGRVMGNANVVPTGYAPQATVSYPPYPLAGYNPNAPSGYAPNVPAGYTPNVLSGYTPNEPAGYSPYAPSGYPPNAPSGYAPNVPAGYAPNVPAGYPYTPAGRVPYAPSGYPPNAPSGYAPNVPAGYAPNAPTYYSPGTPVNATTPTPNGYAPAGTMPLQPQQPRFTSAPQTLSTSTNSPTTAGFNTNAGMGPATSPAETPEAQAPEDPNTPPSR